MMNRFTSFALLLIASVSILYAGEKPASKDSPSPSAWATSNNSLKVVGKYAVAIVRASSTGEARILNRHEAHISTRMNAGDGETTEGGGNVTYADAAQEFTVTEVIAGEFETGLLVLNPNYSRRPCHRFSKRGVDFAE